MKFDLTINNEKREVDVKPNQLLIDVLRDIGYKGVKKGCSEGSCGSCVILVDGNAMKSCLLFVGQAQGHEVTTIEGLGTPEDPHPIQDAFVEEAGVQCGFCIPGMIVSAAGLVQLNPNPSEEEIKEALDGNLCRCTGYTKQIKAVKNAADQMQKER